MPNSGLLYGLNPPDGVYQSQAIGLASGRTYTGRGRGVPNNGFTTLAINRLYNCGVFRPKTAVTINKWCYWVDSVAGTTGTIVRCGLWLVQPNGLPGNLGFDLGLSPGDAINTFYSVVCSAQLAAGVEYMLGIVPQVGATGPKLRTDSSDNSWWGIESANAQQISEFQNVYGLASDGVSGSLPAWPTSYVTGFQGGMPGVALGVL